MPQSQNGNRMPSVQSKAKPKNHPPRLKKSEGVQRRRVKKNGRPSLYSEDMARTICTRIVMGESVRRICRDPIMPNMDTVMGWLHDKPGFSEH